MTTGSSSLATSTSTFSQGSAFALFVLLSCTQYSAEEFELKYGGASLWVMCAHNDSKFSSLVGTSIHLAHGTAACAAHV